MDRQQMLDRIYEISKEARIANKKSVERNDKCMDLPPRSGIRGGKNSSIQAKASIAGEYRNKKIAELKQIMSEFLENF